MNSYPPGAALGARHAGAVGMGGWVGDARPRGLGVREHVLGAALLPLQHRREGGKVELSGSGAGICPSPWLSTLKSGALEQLLPIVPQIRRLGQYVKDVGNEKPPLALMKSTSPWVYSFTTAYV